MRHRHFYFFIWLILELIANQTFAYIIKDDAQCNIVFNHPFQRIISLAPDITEILYAVGAEKQIIGTIKGSDYPVNAKNIPLVGAYNALDVEKIISLKPDLIIVWGNTFYREITFLQKLGITIYKKNSRSLEDVTHAILDFGLVTGHLKEAKIAASQYENELKQLQLQFKSAKKIKAFYQIGSYGLFTINGKSWINQAIEFCGGINIFADARTISPEVTWEAILIKNPDLVITDSLQKNWQTKWQRFRTISAVKHQQYCQVHPDWIDRAGPRLILGVNAICTCIAQSRNLMSHKVSY